MEVIIRPDNHAASLLAARLISNQIINKPSSVLGLATGRITGKSRRRNEEDCLSNISGEGLLPRRPIYQLRLIRQISQIFFILFPSNQ